MGLLLCRKSKVILSHAYFEYDELTNRYWHIGRLIEWLSVWLTGEYQRIWWERADNFNMYTGWCRLFDVTFLQELGRPWEWEINEGSRKRRFFVYYVDGSSIICFVLLLLLFLLFRISYAYVCHCEDLKQTWRTQQPTCPLFTFGINNMCDGTTDMHWLNFCFLF